jgi:DNA repair exonuclease SbcCD ATPase subunit
MNDNLRYVSLQYIKGDNYEDVDSFKVPDIHGVLNKLKDEDLLDNPEKVKELYDKLEKTLEKKKIGESFLEDLINYSSLKLIKKYLDEAKKTAEKKIKELKEEGKKIGNGNEKKGAFLNLRSKIAGLLLDVIEVLDMVKRGDISEPPPVDDAAEVPDPSTLSLPEKAKKFLKKKVKEYLSNVETTKGKIDKIEEKITEFNDNKLSSNVIDDFDKLKDDAIKKVEKLIGEEFIDTPIKTPAEKLLQELQSIISSGKTPIKKIETDAGSIFELVEGSIKTAYDTAEAKPVTDATKAAELAKADKAMILFDIVKSSIDKLNNLVDTTNTNITKLTQLNATIEEVKVKVEEAKTKIAGAVETANKLKTANIQKKEEYQEAQDNANKAKNALSEALNKLKTLLEEAYKLLEGLHKNVIKQSDALEKDKKVYLKSLDSLVALYSSYINICKKNILKYDKLFEHNEISNIDEAFMIKSYSDFLKKLNKLKKNLETKDINKIRRALTDSINRLFNMYGVNTNNEAFMKALFEGYNDNGTDKDDPDAKDDKKNKDIDYIIERIINYNLAK